VSTILLFPPTKRTGTIRRWASNIATYHKVKSRENTIRVRLETVADGLRRIGFHTASLETALRIEIGRLRHYNAGRSA